MGAGLGAHLPAGSRRKAAPRAEVRSASLPPGRRVGVRNPAPGAGKMQLSPIRFC